MRQYLLFFISVKLLLFNIHHFAYYLPQFRAHNRASYTGSPIVISNFIILFPITVQSYK